MKQLLYISLFLMLLVPGCASFPHINSGSVGVKTDNIHVKVAFGDSDRRIIHDYYSKQKPKHKSLPPGLAKKKKLPPGLQKSLRKIRNCRQALLKGIFPMNLKIIFLRFHGVMSVYKWEET